jgi:hypothetical protein
MKKLIFLFLIGAVLISSCDKDEPNTNNDSVLTKANIAGEVSLFDQFGQSVSDERMMIYMENTSETFWAESEKDGSFLVPNVSYFNNYKISYEKEGFGSYKRFGFEHKYTGEEGSISNVNLSMKSTSYCSSLIVSQSNDTTHFQLSLAGSSDGGKRKIRLLFHTIPEISHEIYSHNTVKFTANNTQPTISLSKEYLLEEVGLISGETYYVQVYGDSFYSNSYFDEDLQKSVLPNLGYSEDVSVPTGTFIMP